MSAGNENLREEFNKVYGTFVDLYNATHVQEEGQKRWKFVQYYQTMYRRDTIDSHLQVSFESYKMLGELLMKFETGVDSYRLSHVRFRNEIEPDEGMISSMRKFIKNYDSIKAVGKTITIFLEDFEEERKQFLTKNVDPAKIEEINKLVQEWHDENLIQNSVVYQLWSDGETTSTKGGELFGQRRLIPEEYEFYLPEGYKFPCTKTGVKETYAIMSYENCIKVAKMMLDTSYVEE